MDTFAVIQSPNALADFGAQANEAAARAVSTLYQERRPINTQRSQRAAISLFSEFVQSAGIRISDLYPSPSHGKASAGAWCKPFSSG